MAIQESSASIKYIYFKRKLIGHIDYKNKCYVTFRNDDHYFRKFEGFGMSVNLLDCLQKEGIELIIVNYKNEIVYYSYVADFLVHGHEWNDDGDDQLILHMSKWKIYDNPKEEKMIQHQETL